MLPFLKKQGEPANPKATPFSCSGYGWSRPQNTVGNCPACIKKIHMYIRKQPLQPQFLEYFSPQRSMLETNPETCFVHDLCPPTTTPLSLRIISICNPFNLNLLKISAHNEACLRLTLKHASYTASVHPRLPPFPSGSSPSATLQPQSPENFSPQRRMFETNPETCFVHILCPPTATPLSPSATPSTSISNNVPWTDCMK